jgi:hypothetical protein
METVEVLFSSRWVLVAITGNKWNSKFWNYFLKELKILELLSECIGP